MTNKYFIAGLLIAFGIIMRLLPHEPNFAPVGAIALFSGAVLGWRIAAWLPVVLTIGADLFIGFYPGMMFTSLGFAVIGLFGALFARTSIFVRVLAGGLGSGIIFYLISNFGVWLMGGLYPQTMQGLIDCYVMALPFLRVSLLADLFYAALFFGLYEFALYPVRKPAKNRLPSAQ